MQLDEITTGIMGFVAVLAKEHEALFEWKQNATTHYMDRDALCIGRYSRNSLGALEPNHINFLVALVTTL